MGLLQGCGASPVEGSWSLAGSDVLFGQDFPRTDVLLRRFQGRGLGTPSTADTARASGTTAAAITGSKATTAACTTPATAAATAAAIAATATVASSASLAATTTTCAAANVTSRRVDLSWRHGVEGSYAPGPRIGRILLWHLLVLLCFLYGCCGAAGASTVQANFARFACGIQAARGRRGVAATIGHFPLRFPYAMFDEKLA